MQNEENILKTTISKFLAERFESLPENDRKLFAYGPLYLGINGAFAGLIGNSLFRRILNISQARLASSLPMAVLPFLTTVAAYNAVVTEPLLSGDLNCATCAVVRGGLVGSIVGGLYPILLALPVNGGLAFRYETAPLPQKGNILRFWTTVSKPVLRKMSFVFLLQAAFGGYLSSRLFSLYEKMLQPPAPGAN
ncbi:transmembrane protein 126A [Bombina bombina]|uniref:transmembrane protein 126A n=1 Tax=Bombina bombina TaxID=8345 RepID=UPI00235B00E4|nr:transmembrane protein 126A [Bombina bombina]XP_053564636.1 transmembrane protein 126A [Bombina bombina]